MKLQFHSVSGGDGIHLGGNSYISNTNTITGRLGVLGAATLAFEVGYGVGSALNNRYGWGQDIGGYVYENS